MPQPAASTNQHSSDPTVKVVISSKQKIRRHLYAAGVSGTDEPRHAAVQHAVVVPPCVL
jgi:hypothetical protein